MRHIIYRTERIDFDSGQRLRETGASVPVEVEVVEAREDGYSLRWTYGAMAFDKDMELLWLQKPDALSISFSQM